MAACQYEEWCETHKRIETCGEEAELCKLPFVGAGRSSAVLCARHREFVLDAVNDYEIRLHKLKEKQRKARIREQIKQLQLELKTGEWDNA